MSVSGLCGICQTAEAVDQCDRCGTLVCDQHYAADQGLCMTCSSQGGVS